jgi:hypothetical protein
VQPPGLVPEKMFDELRGRRGCLKFVRHVEEPVETVQINRE